MISLLKSWFLILFIKQSLIIGIPQDKMEGNPQFMARRWISTTAQNAWSERMLPPSLNVNNPDIEILIDKKEQKIDGFGGCFNEIGWNMLQQISQEEREKVIKSLFDPTDGCKFNICRMPIGASDYALEWYSHNESDGDYEMKNFSINRDKNYLIPFIQAALKYKPDLILWASPWSPPTWMKKNRNYACKPSSKNKFKETPGKEGQNLFIMDDKTLKAYALYFSKFVQAYKQEGIEINSVHVQNEFNSCQIFPSCTWTATGLALFIGKYIGPQFEQDNLKTEIWLGTFERSNKTLADSILENADCKKYIKGLGVQWGGRDALFDIHSKFPNLPIMQTETECGDGSNNWKAAEHTWKLMKQYFTFGINSYMYWNMVLDESGNSTWGWKQNAMITINSKTKKVTYTPEFYLMKHLSHFVKPGAYRLGVSKIFSDLLAFQNPDGEIVVVVVNDNDKDKTIHIKVKDKIVSPTLHAKSFNTIILN